MKRNDIALYVCIGLIALAAASFLFNIKSSIIASISIATLVFTFAQTIEAFISYREENLRRSLEVNNKTKVISLTETQMMLMDVFIKYMNPDKKQRTAKVIATVLYIIAFVILFLGFVVPVTIDERICSAVTILSAAMIFFSMWLAELNIRKAEQWNEILKLNLMQPDIEAEQNSDVQMTSTPENEVK